MDEQFTNKIIAWLESPHETEENIIEGATLMLQCNRNRVLYNNVIKKPFNFVDKFDYELHKHLRYRADHLTIEGVIKLDKEIVKPVEDTIAAGQPVDNDDDDNSSDNEVDGVARLGKRKDHDSLPDEITLLWTENAARYKKIKQLYETLKTMTDAQPCDRYEYLKPLKELYDAYHRDMEIYDNYKEGDELPAVDEVNDDTDIVKGAKALNAARKFVSVTVKALETPDGVPSDKRDETIDKLKENLQIIDSLKAKVSQKMQDRINKILSATADVTSAEAAVAQDATGESEQTDGEDKN